MKILVIDNYDSFTYNLVQYLKDLSAGELVVRRNDEIELEEINYDAMNLTELKSELRAAGLPLGGKKADLIQRLKDSEE